MRKFSFKIVLLGDQSVGKTSLVYRFVNDTFSENYISTIGADFLIKDLALEDAAIRLMIWDLGGQEYWETLRNRYMKGADGCILVFDTSREDNIKNYINRWLKEIQNSIKGEIPVIIVGNKNDLEPGVDLEKAAEFFKILKMPYIATSAKTGNRVEAMFQRITADILSNKIATLKKSSP